MWLDRRSQLYRRARCFKLVIDTKMVAPKCASACNSYAQYGVAAYCPAPLPSTVRRQRP